MDDLELPDLLGLRGSVLAASDEFFAAKENLLTAAAPVFTPFTFGPKGQVYDGWETRRQRGGSGTLPPADESDWVICRLGQPGVVHAVVVDTSFFTGNYPAACSVEACFAAGYPAAAELSGWTPVVARSELSGDQRQVFPVRLPRRFSHVRLRIYPDGGVARLRVHGEVVPPPGMLDGLTIDLAALENGADVVACSDEFYSVPRNVISPGLARVMGDGWETRRRRTPGNEWLTLRLAGHGTVRLVEVDTSGYRGNAPAAFSVQTGDGQAFTELISGQPLQPDTVHRFRVDAPPATHARLSIFPDGGIARLRLYGPLTAAGFDALRDRWRATALS